MVIVKRLLFNPSQVTEHDRIRRLTARESRGHWKVTMMDEWVEERACLHAVTGGDQWSSSMEGKIRGEGEKGLKPGSRGGQGGKRTKRTIRGTESTDPPRLWVGGTRRLRTVMLTTPLWCHLTSTPLTNQNTRALSRAWVLEVGLACGHCVEHSPKDVDVTDSTRRREAQPGLQVTF